MTPRSAASGLVSRGDCRVELLGDARLIAQGRVLRFVPDKRFALLGYLALADAWVSREELARLFWPEQGSREAKRNLRQLLQRLQALGPVAAWGLELTRQQLRWHVQSDVAAFYEALETDALEAATALYRGPLLQGQERYDSDAFAHWLELERAALHGRWREAVLRRAETLSARGQLAAAARVLGEVLARDALDEPALAALMTANARAGHKEAALSAYQLFARRLAAELGLEPSVGLQELARSIDAQRHEREEPAPLSSLAACPFVGRERELSELAQTLLRPDCRLLSVTGPGGVGKSRVAQRLAREVAARFSGGVFVVALASVSAPEGLAVAIAEAASFELQGPVAPLEQLARWIGERELLLLLDNVEHLLAGAASLAVLLERCPGLTLLVTSRERLNLSEEWLAPLSGLPWPEEAVSAADALRYPAVALFVERAQRVRPDFALERELLEVCDICRMVGGSPLAIELAAVWVRALPCHEIAQEILGNLDFLASSRDAPDRHRSVRAVFEHSWQLLKPPEKRALRQLAACRGGFSAEAAMAVAGAPLALLGALLDKSLLTVRAGGRYLRHPLLYGFSRAKLAEHPADEARARRRHGRYFLRLVQRRGPSYQGGAGEQAALELLEQELANVVVAWSWALEALELRALRAALEPLMLFYDLRGRFREGAELFARSAAALDEVAPEQRALKGELLVAEATLYVWLGGFEDAKVLVRRALALLGEEGWARMTGLNVLGFCALIGGALGEARRFWSEALTLAKRRRNPLASLELLSNLTLVAAWSGDRAQMPALLEEAGARLLALRAHRAVVYSTLTLGFARLLSGERDEARRLQQRGLELARELGEGRYLPHLLYGLGMTASDSGQPEAALAYCQEALDLARRSGDVLAETWALAVMAAAARELGDAARAGACAASSLQLARASHNLMALPYALVLATGVWAETNPARAAALLARALRQPAMGVLARRLAESVGAALPAPLPAEGSSEGWTDLADEVLRLLAVSAPAAEPGALI